MRTKGITTTTVECTADSIGVSGSSPTLAHIWRINTYGKCFFWLQLNNVAHTIEHHESVVVFVLMHLLLVSECQCN